jgi:hypothetical protein
MSQLLDYAARLDPQRRIDLARNDAASGYASPCAACRICGGNQAPRDSGLCRACRSLAAVFAARETVQ